jgi:hypothetical protein
LWSQIEMNADAVAKQLEQQLTPQIKAAVSRGGRWGRGRHTS